MPVKRSFPLLLVVLAAITLAIGMFALLGSAQVPDPLVNLWCCCSSDGEVFPATAVTNPTVCKPPHDFFIPQLTFSQAQDPNICVNYCQNVTQIKLPTVPPKLPPSISNFVVKPVKGELQLNLSWVIEEPMDFIEIMRCEGDCTDFQLIDVVPEVSNYIDESNLRWKTGYTYQVQAFNIVGESTNLTATGNTGDIECWDQTTTETFCISEFYYSDPQIIGYLMTFGYAGVTDRNFSRNYFNAVNAAFNTFPKKFQKAWRCDDRNRLQLEQSCGPNQVCTADGTTVKCVTDGPCDDIGNPFGLYFSQQSCEGTGLNQKFCFFDRSYAAINNCWSCNPSQRCLDYHTRETCERNPCGIGQCEWRDTIPDLGVGACIDTRHDNCVVFSRPRFAANAQAANSVFEQPSIPIAKALSTEKAPCFLRDGVISSCEQATCRQIPVLQCLDGAIQRDPETNAITTGSPDPCGFDVCRIFEFGCAKDSDTDGQPDCNPVTAPPECEPDVYPPNTIAFPVGILGRHEFVTIRVKDRLTGTGPEIDFTGQEGYITRVCIPATQDCSVAANYPINVSVSRLLVKNLELKLEEATLGTLEEGFNTIRLYSIDAQNNIEIVKNISVFACRDCQGPTILDLTIIPGRRIGEVSPTTAVQLYTHEASPTIQVRFDEPAIMEAARLVKTPEGTTFPFLFQSFENNTLWNLKLQADTFLTNGTYRFTFLAKNDKGLYNIPLNHTVVVDSTAPLLTFTPPNGAVLDDTETTITIESTKPLSIRNAVLEEQIFTTFDGSNVVVRTVEIPLPLVSPAVSVNSTFITPEIEDLGQGKHTIRIDALDFTGLPLEASAEFFVSTEPTEIALLNPSFGIAATWPFGITVLTTNTAECKYLFGAPVPPAPTDPTFAALLGAFDQTNDFVHTINAFNFILQGDTKPHKFHVYCKDTFGVSLQSFELRVDPEPVAILSLEAIPNPILEPVAAGLQVYETELHVGLNKPGFCKYAETNVRYAQMPFEFAGINVTPKTSVIQAVNVTSVAQHTRHVACAGLNELPGPTQQVSFFVDLTIPLRVTPVPTPPLFFGNLTLAFGARTNKKAFCYWGTDPDNLINLMAPGEPSLTHNVLTLVREGGSYTIHVQCTNSLELTDVIEIKAFVDITPPIMEYVDASQDVVPGEPFITYHTDRLQVAFKAVENETEVTRYEYQIEEKITGNLLLNFTPDSKHLDGEPFFITGLNLTDLTSYVFKVRAENTVGLVSDIMESTAVIVDVSTAPEFCENGQQDAGEGETGVDCGGPCDGCDLGEACDENADCASELCNPDQNVCVESTCDDGLEGPDETDVDCGGVCVPCDIGKKCAINADCVLGAACELGICVEGSACADGLKTEGSGETDVDCGGPCPGCLDGQNCVIDQDCDSGLFCDPDQQVCGDFDEDKDGVPNYLEGETCLGTLPAERALVDENGCGPSQLFTCKDGIPDGWRGRYFGAVPASCNGEGRADADPDKDGFTNYEEFLQGSDPTDRDDPGKRPTVVGKILKSLLWLLLLLLLAFAAYILWSKYGERFVEKKKAPPAPPPRAPLRRLPPRKKPPAPAIQKLKEKLGLAPKAPEEYVSLADVQRQVGIGGLKREAREHKGVIEKLRKLKAGTLPKDEQREVLEHFKKEHPELLHRAAVQRIAKATKRHPREIKREEHVHPHVFKKLRKVAEGKFPRERGEREIIDHFAKEHRPPKQKKKRVIGRKAKK